MPLRYFCLLVFAGTLSIAQQGTGFQIPSGAGSINSGASTPGSCASPPLLFYNTSNGNYYGCNNVNAYVVFQSSSSGVNAVQGTSNQITATTTTGTVTISLPANILVPGSLTFQASTTAGASFNLPSGVAPTSPNAGDFWNLSGILQYYAGGTHSLVNLDSTQTLTNKTLDGVTPTVMSYLDATSSIQTQLNGKQASITTGSQDQVLNGTLGLTTLVTCTAAGGVYRYSTSTHAFTCYTLLASDIPTLNQNTTGYAAGLAGGSIGQFPYQSAANTTAFLAGNTAATDQVLVSHGTGSAAQAPTLSNAPALSAANMTSFPTFNQNTTGNAGTATALAASPTNCNAGNFPLGINASGTAQNCTKAPQQFFGTAAPGSVSGNLPGDRFSDTTNHNDYWCDAPSGTAAPACTSVTTGGWTQSNVAGSSSLLSGTLAAIPSTCTVGVSLYQATDQPISLQLYACTATNTWTRQAYLSGTIAGIPATCSVPQMYFATNATAGQNWYFCTATNTWTQQLNSGGSGQSVFTGSVATNSTGIGGTAAAPTISLSDQSVKSPVRFEFAMSASVTSVTINNKTAGAKFSIVWNEGSTGGYSLTHGSSVVSGSTCETQIPTTANAWMEQFYEVESDGATVIGEHCVSNQNYWAGPEIAMSAVTAPASGGACGFDSTAHIQTCKENSATSNTVVPSTAASHQFFNTLSAAGVLGSAQPAFSDLAAGTVGAAATFPGGDLFCGGVNAQSGTSYTIVATDACKLVTYNNGSSVAVTLPQATTTGFGSGAYFYQYNRGAGAVTITPTTSTINGGSTIVLNQNQGAFIMSDGTNYSAWISSAPSGSGTVTSLTCGSGLSGGTITTTGTCALAAGAVNPETTTYQVLASDFSAYKTITVASGTFTITLVASGSQPANGQYINIVNYGSGTVTVARSGQDINGATTSLTVAANSSVFIVSDGTNYFASQQIGPNVVTLSNLVITPTQAGLSNVTNNAQTQAAIMPNTAPPAGQIPVGNAGGTAYAPVAMSQDCTLSSAGVITCTKTNNVAFGTAATVNTGTSGATIPLLNGVNTYGGKQTFPGGDLFLGGVNAQTGTTYTVVAGDANKLVTYSNALAVAVTLPQATTTGFGAGAFFPQKNLGAGTVTITPTTSTINGAATLVLTTNQDATIYSDGTNYFATVDTGTGNTVTGGTCTNQVATAIAAITAVPTCTTLVLSAVNPETTTYQVLASDFSNYKTITVASGSFTITLVASGSQPANGQYINIINYGSGTVTISRSGQNINGATTSLTMPTNSNAFVISDGTNYFASQAVNPNVVTLSNLVITPTQAGLSNVTNNAQTQAAVMPNAAPSAGQFPVGNVGGTAYAPQSMSGDCTLASTGAVTCTQLNGSNFTVNSSGVATKIAGVVTVGNGAPVEGWRSVVTGVSSSQSTVTLATAPAAGGYRINYNAFQNALASSGSCSVYFTFTWTDAGATRSQNTNTFTLGTVQGSGTFMNGLAPIEIASGNVTYSSTLTGSCPSATYNVRVVLEAF